MVLALSNCMQGIALPGVQACVPVSLDRFAARIRRAEMKLGGIALRRPGPGTRLAPDPIDRPRSTTAGRHWASSDPSLARSADVITEKATLAHCWPHAVVASSSRACLPVDERRSARGPAGDPVRALRRRERHPQDHGPRRQRALRAVQLVHLQVLPPRLVSPLLSRALDRCPVCCPCVGC